MSKNTNTFCAVISSFESDAGGAFEVVRSLQREFPGIPVLIAEDKRKPFTQAQRDAFLNRWGDKVVCFTVREYDGGGNLRGLPCIRGQLALMLQFAEETGATHVFKIDSDIVVNPDGLFDWLDKCDGKTLAVFPNTKGGVNDGSEKYPDGWGFGFCYVLSVEALELLKPYFAKKRKLDDPGEDIAISGACMELFPDAIGWIPFGRFAGYSYAPHGIVRPIGEAIEQWKQGLAVSMFGNRYTMPNRWPDAVRRQTAAQFARYLNNVIERETKE